MFHNKKIFIHNLRFLFRSSGISSIFIDFTELNYTTDRAYFCLINSINVIEFPEPSIKQSRIILKYWDVLSNKPIISIKKNETSETFPRNDYDDTKIITENTSILQNQKNAVETLRQ